MKVLVVGAGKMGRAIVMDLDEAAAVEAVTVADRDLELARRVAGERSGGKVRAAGLDADDEGAVAKLIEGHDVVVGAADYRLNEGLARRSIEARAHFCDLGGNNTVVDRELAMDRAAADAGVTIVPDCGLAPGMVSVLVAHGVSRFTKVDRVSIRVGGLPVEPKGPLRYQLVFSVRGLTNEYLEPAVVLRGGRRLTVPSLTEVEELEFPAPFGRLEAFQTSGGTSTLPATYGSRIPDLDYKTIRYPGHCAIMKSLADLGFLSEEPVLAGGAAVKPREATEAVLVRTLPSEGEDAVLVRVTFEGEAAGRRRRWEYQCVEYGEKERGLTAMMRMTAFPTSIVAQMLGAGTIERRGAVPQEGCVPPEKFMAELARRRIDVVQRETLL